MHRDVTSLRLFFVHTSELLEVLYSLRRVSYYIYLIIVIKLLEYKKYYLESKILSLGLYNLIHRFRRLLQVKKITCCLLYSLIEHRYIN